MKFILELPQADNCPRENKNNSVLKWMCYITATLKMSVSALQFARVGHTHGPLGHWVEFRSSSQVIRTRVR